MRDDQVSSLRRALRREPDKLASLCLEAAKIRARDRPSDPFEIYWLLEVACAREPQMASPFYVRYRDLLMRTLFLVAKDYGVEVYVREVTTVGRWIAHSNPEIWAKADQDGLTICFGSGRLFRLDRDLGILDDYDA